MLPTPPSMASFIQSELDSDANSLYSTGSRADSAPSTLQSSGSACTFVSSSDIKCDLDDEYNGGNYM